MSYEASLLSAVSHAVRQFFTSNRLVIANNERTDRPNGLDRPTGQNRHCRTCRCFSNEPDIVAFIEPYRPDDIREGNNTDLSRESNSDSDDSFQNDHRAAGLEAIPEGRWLIEANNSPMGQDEYRSSDDEYEAYDRFVRAVPTTPVAGPSAMQFSAPDDDYEIEAQDDGGPSPAAAINNAESDVNNTGVTCNNPGTAGRSGHSSQNTTNKNTSRSTASKRPFYRFDRDSDREGGDRGDRSAGGGKRRYEASRLDSGSFGPSTSRQDPYSGRPSFPPRSMPTIDTADTDSD